LLGVESSMANPDLAAPNAAILPNGRFSRPFAGREAQLPPVAETVPASVRGVSIEVIARC
jgi:hypothetical protein